MIKIILPIFVFIFMALTCVSPSWAMGKAKKRGGPNSANFQGSSYAYWESEFNEASSQLNNSPSFGMYWDSPGNHSWNNGHHNGHHNNHHGSNHNENESPLFPDNDDVVIPGANENDSPSNPNNVTPQNSENPVVPEPMTLSLLGMGLAGVLLKRKK